MPSRRSITTLVVIASAAALLLSGCSAVKAVTDVQTKAQACVSIAKTTQKAASGIPQAFSTFSTDPSAAEAAMQKFHDEFAATAAKVKNPTIKKLADQTTTDLQTLSDAVTAAASDPTKADALQTAASTMQDDFTSIGKACS